MNHMFYRNIIKALKKWSKKANRKPLVLRGARQVGKTTAVKLFAEQFEQYIYLNLELADDRNLFTQNYNIAELLEALFFLKNAKTHSQSTLIFIDEIQAEPKAMAMLRYFYEEAPAYHIIAAGSLLENILNKNISFPVGRVEYLRMYPVSFKEYLHATGERQAVDILEKIPCPAFANEKLLKLFHRYTLIGGMPEIVEHYANNKELTALQSIYESLLIAYVDDVEKYANNESQARVIRHVIQTAFHVAGERIKMAGFGHSNYTSREVSEAIQLLEKSFLLQRIYPTTATELPMLPDLKKAPRLQLLDTGLVNYFSGIQQEIFGTKDLNNLYSGRITEHIVGQEIQSQSPSLLNPLYFWVRQKSQSNAEVDFVLQHHNKLIPIEVKSGATGRLRSLHQFIERTHHSFAIRLYAGKLCTEQARTTAGTEFTLLNLPYYLAGELEQYLPWLLENHHAQNSKK